MDGQESLRAYHAQLPHAVQSEMTVDTFHRVLYHISPNPGIPVFVPRQIQRVMNTEDETIKRVCTGISVLDCIRGYAVSIRDFLDKKAHCAGKDEWLGGYTIYALPVEGSLAPSKVLAPIAEWCEERWLVNHAHDNQPYPAKAIGKCFIEQLKVSSHEGEKTLETYVLLETKTPLSFAPLFQLKPGYYRLTVPTLERYTDRPLDYSQIEMQPLSEREFNAIKEHKAGLLSYEIAQQSSIRW